VTGATILGALRPPAAPIPDLGNIMTHFNEALALLVVCQRSLVEHDDEIHDAVHEEIVIRTAIAKFRNVYDEIGVAEQLIRQNGRVMKRRD
jgi:hypothetical protein